MLRHLLELCFPPGGVPLSLQFEFANNRGKSAPRSQTSFPSGPARYPNLVMDYLGHGRWANASIRACPRGYRTKPKNDWEKKPDKREQLLTSKHSMLSLPKLEKKTKDNEAESKNKSNADRMPIRT